MKRIDRQLQHQYMRTSLLGHKGTKHHVRRVLPPPPPAPADDEELRRQAEIENDLLMARDIQQGLLLEAVPRLPGWEISAASLPARDLGGDLYDFLPLGDNSHGIMIGDVSGKGLPAALRMAVTRTVFRHEARRGEGPGATLAAVNEGVLSEIPQGMVTMLYVLLDTKNGEIRIANAGHNYPVIINGQVHEVELTGIPLGVVGESDYSEVVATLQHGDTVLLYTDGVIEATNSQEEIYSYERLEAVLKANEGMKPRALLATLLHELRSWGGANQADDITMVILRRRQAELGAELYSVAEDVLGRERASQLWAELQMPSNNLADEWTEKLPEIIRATQTRFGRGLARELNGQLRLAIEEYR